jgi:membrane protease subunit HflC
MKDKNIKYIILAVAAIILLISSFFIVDQTQQAIVLQFGESKRIEKDPGLHFKIPFIQNVMYFDNRLLSLTADEKELIAKDQKRVIISAYAKYEITDPLKFYQTVKTVKGLEARLNNILDSSLRQVIGEEPLSSLLSDARANIMQDIQQIVNRESLKFGIDVVDVRILRADLPNENSAAIYKRMQADREKEAKEFRAQGEEEAQIIQSTSEKERTIILSKAYKEAQILKGEGDATAGKIYADAFKVDPEFYNFYRSLEAYKKSFNNKENTSIILSPKGEFLRYFNN